MTDIFNDHPDEFKTNWGQLLQRKEKSQGDWLASVSTKLSTVVAQQKPIAIAEEVRGSHFLASEVEAVQAQDLG